MDGRTLVVVGLAVAEIFAVACQPMTGIGPTPFKVSVAPVTVPATCPTGQIFDGAVCAPIGVREPITGPCQIDRICLR